MYERFDYAVSGGVVGTVYVLTHVLSRWRRPRSKSKEATSAEFRRFERAYVVAFLLCLACEYVQASMIFALMRHKHAWSFVQIAEVYAVGFAASWATTSFFSAEKMIGKSQCVFCLASYGAAAMLAATGKGLRTIIASRILAGIAQPLLQSAFDGWMRMAHSDSGFPAAWRRSTYEFVGKGTTFVSIASGALAEGLRQVSRDDAVPFQLSAAFSILGCLAILVFWPTSSASARVISTDSCLDQPCLIVPTSCPTRKGIRAAAAALSAGVFETTAYVTNATWATALARLEKNGRSPYGFVFALLMACAVSGTHLFSFFASANTERVSVILSLLAGLAFAILSVFQDQPSLASVLLPLFLSQVCAGWSVPVFASLKAKHVPNELRKPFARFSNVVHGGVVLALILVVPADTQLTFAICAGLMCISFMATLRLYFAST